MQRPGLCGHTIHGSIWVGLRRFSALRRRTGSRRWSRKLISSRAASTRAVLINRYLDLVEKELPEGRARFPRQTIVEGRHPEDRRLRRVVAQGLAYDPLRRSTSRRTNPLLISQLIDA